MPTGLNRAPKGRDLATIKARYASATVGAGLGSNHYWARYEPETRYQEHNSILFDLPFQRTEYVNSDSKGKWVPNFEQYSLATGELQPVSAAWDKAAPFEGGRTYHQEWNKAVFAPSVSGPEYASDYVVRTGDTIWAGIPRFGEGPGHPGGSILDSAKLSLYRGDTLVDSLDSDHGEFKVPADTANYRLELTANRGAPHAFSTRVLGTWTFRSGHVDGKTPKQLAISTVRFNPKLDSANKTPSGKLLAVPVHVDHQLATCTTKLSVEASFDDGKTWKSVPVSGSGDHRVALVRHPSGTGFVSLRAHATDRGGNKLDQTVIRAYAIS